MKTQFESLHRLSNIFKKLCNDFTTKIQRNLISIKKHIIENQEKKYIELFRFQKNCAIYCLKFTTHKKLNCVKNIFKNCCSI